MFFGERFGDQECRLWPLAGQQPFREGRDENHRNVLKLRQYVVHRVDARRIVGELDIGEDQARTPLCRKLDRFRPGAGDAGDTVANFGDDAGNIQRDDRFILDHQNVACDRVFHLPAGDINEIGGLSVTYRHDLPNFGRGELFYDMQQQGFARIGGQVDHMVLSPRRQIGVRFADRGTGAGPDHMKCPEQGHLGVTQARKFGTAGDDRLKCRGRVAITAGLTAGQGPCVAAQIRQMTADARRHVVRFVVGVGRFHRKGPLPGFFSSEPNALGMRLVPCKLAGLETNVWQPMAQKNDAQKLRAQIDENLKRVYDEALETEVPDRFKLLLEELRKKAAQK